jgi:hypothetical protein
MQTGRRIRSVVLAAAAGSAVAAGDTTAAQAASISPRPQTVAHDFIPDSPFLQVAAVAAAGVGAYAVTTLALASISSRFDQVSATRELSAATRDATQLKIDEAATDFLDGVNVDLLFDSAPDGGVAVAMVVHNRLGVRIDEARVGALHVANVTLGDEESGRITGRLPVDQDFDAEGLALRPGDDDLGLPPLTLRNIEPGHEEATEYFVLPGVTRADLLDGDRLADAMFGTYHLTEFNVRTRLQYLDGEEDSDRTPSGIYCGHAFEPFIADSPKHTYPDL